MIQRSKIGLNFFPRRFRCHVYLRDQSIVVMRDILQSRYLRSNIAHKQLARTSLSDKYLTVALNSCGNQLSLITRQKIISHQKKGKKGRKESIA